MFTLKQDIPGDATVLGSSCTSSTQKVMLAHKERNPIAVAFCRAGMQFWLCRLLG